MKKTNICEFRGSLSIRPYFLAVSPGYSWSDAVVAQVFLVHTETPNVALRRDKTSGSCAQSRSQLYLSRNSSST